MEAPHGLLPCGPGAKAISCRLEWSPRGPACRASHTLGEPSLGPAARILMSSANVARTTGHRKTGDPVDAMPLWPQGRDLPPRLAPPPQGPACSPGASLVPVTLRGLRWTLLLCVHWSVTLPTRSRIALGHEGAWGLGLWLGAGHCPVLSRAPGQGRMPFLGPTPFSLQAGLGPEPPPRHLCGPGRLHSGQPCHCQRWSGRREGAWPGSLVERAR